MTVNPSHKVLVILGPDLMARASAKAARHRISRSEYIRRLIEDDLDRGEVGQPSIAAQRGDMASSRPEAMADPWVEPTLDAEPFEDPA